MPRIFYCLNIIRLHISRRAFHLRTIFEAYLKTSHDFLKLNFLHFTPYVRLIFLFKNVIEREIRKIIIFVKRAIASNDFLENNTEVLVISKSLKFP